MITQHQINELMEGLDTEQRLDFLEKVEFDLHELLSAGNIEQDDYDELIDYVIDKVADVLNQKYSKDVE